MQPQWKQALNNLILWTSTTDTVRRRVSENVRRKVQ